MINTTVVLNSLSALPRAAIVLIIYKVIVMITTVGHSLQYVDLNTQVKNKIKKDFYNFADNVQYFIYYP